MNNELYHIAFRSSSGRHKYIKREWKNGRWNYTYPTESTVKGNVSNVKTIRENTNNRLSATDKVKKAINTAKDKLGFDERAEYKKTKQTWDKAVDERNKADRKIDNFNEANKHTPYDKYDYDYSNELHSDYQFWKERAEMRGREHMKARSAYLNTPIGNFLKAKDFIDDVTFEVGYGVEKAADKVKNTAEDVAWEVGYGVRKAGRNVEKAIGISQKRELDAATAALERNKKDRNIPYPNATERVLAELRQKDIEDSYRKAANAYSGTPLHHIETGMDYIENLFKKKRKK